MPYLPNELPKAKVLITVKTYPLPSQSYVELVCTAGLLDGEKWIRIYPVPFRFLQDDQQYKKFNWVELDLKRRTKDFRPESYRPKMGIDEKIKVLSKVGTANDWSVRKQYVLKEVFTSLDKLIELAKGSEKKSLATIKPKEIIDFTWEAEDREWKKSWVDQRKQLSFFDKVTQSTGGQKPAIEKVPYKFSYKFLSDGDKKAREIMVEDWEVGALFWNCLRRTDGDEKAALELVKQKYLYEFSQKDLYFFVGTTFKFHNIAPNPFVIIGVFYPPKTQQPSLL
jgi:hypothetical protein